MDFRIARHSQNIEKLKYFYTSIFDFEVLGSFKYHDGYDGVFLGKPDENWHLEFTQNAEKPDSKFDDDDVLVFYPTTSDEYQSILNNIEKYKIPMLEPKNPYWKSNGITIEDCDHFKIIISDARIIK